MRTFDIPQEIRVRFRSMIMSIFWRELKINVKPFVFWGLGIFVLMVEVNINIIVQVF